MYDPYHPALLVLMAHIAKSANEAGIWAGICGALGADPKMQERFIKMGCTELSMAWRPENLSVNLKFK